MTLCLIFNPISHSTGCNDSSIEFFIQERLRNQCFPKVVGLNYTANIDLSFDRLDCALQTGELRNTQVRTYNTYNFLLICDNYHVLRRNLMNVADAANLDLTIFSRELRHIYPLNSYT